MPATPSTPTLTRQPIPLPLHSPYTPSPCRQLHLLLPLPGNPSHSPCTAHTPHPHAGNSIYSYPYPATHPTLPAQAIHPTPMPATPSTPTLTRQPTPLSLHRPYTPPPCRQLH